MTPNGTPQRHAQEMLDAYFGTPVNPRAFGDWLQHIATVIGASKRRWLSGHHNLHSLYQLQRNSDIRKFYQRCDDCYIDGTPVRFILGTQDNRSAERFSLMDYFPTLLREAERRHWSVFYLGATVAVVAAATTRIEKEYPRLQIELRHGYAKDSGDDIAAINQLRPDLLLVGMGMPTQERWLLQHLDTLDVGVVLQAGATLDYFSGAQAQPPAWISRLGLAWLYRLIASPGRLWRRYLCEPWALLIPTLRLRCHLWRRDS